MNRTRTLACLVGLVTILPSLAISQDTSTPEASTTAAMELMRISDWAGMADLMHPDALAELRDLLLPVLQHPDMEEFRVEMFGLSSAEEASTLSGSDIYQSLIALTLGSEPELANIMSTATADVIGHVMEGETAHVVFRMKMNVEGMPFSQMGVSSLQEVDGRWLALLTADLKGIIAGLQQMLSELE